MAQMKTRVEGKYCHVVEHPVVQHKLAALRNKRTTSASFRSTLEEISELLAYEVTRDLPVEAVEVQTPFAMAKSYNIVHPPVLVSIMRAGNGMLAGMMRLLSFSSVGHIGIYRDKFIKNTVEYYFRLPHDVKGKQILLLDPLLATGDTAVAAISRLKQYEVGPIRFVTILASNLGLEKLKAAHPDVEVFTLSVEPELNEKGYILPGLGDAGDRIYGTDPEPWSHS